MDSSNNQLVSVIIPTYGKPTRLRKTLMSVFDQSYKNIEVIVVDDNGRHTSTSEQTEAVVSGLLKDGYELQYVRHDENRNGAAARNTGLSHSRGDFVAFLDSDDEYYPDRIQRCVETLSATDPVVAGVYSGCEFRRHGKRWGEITDVSSGNFLLETLCCLFNFSSGSNIFIRREVAFELDGFDESFIRHQDYEFLVRLFEKYELIAIPDILLIKNDEQPNMPSVERMIDVKNQYLQKYRYLIDEMPAKDQHKVTYFNCIRLAEQATGSGKWRIAFRYYFKAACTRPLLPMHVLRFIGLSSKRLLGDR